MISLNVDNAVIEELYRDDFQNEDTLCRNFMDLLTIDGQEERLPDWQDFCGEVEN